MCRTSLALLALLPASAWAERPPGAIIPSAVAIDVTQAGFDRFIPIADSFIPDSFQMDVVVQETTFPSFQAADCDNNFCYEYSVTNLDAQVDLLNPDLTLGYGVIEFSAVLDVTVNSAANPMEVYFRGAEGLLGWIDFEQDCDLWIDPFQVPVSGAIQVNYNTFNNQVTVDILPVQYDLSALNSDTVRLDDCATATITEIADSFGYDLIQMVIDQILPMVDDQVDALVSDLDAQLEPLLQDAVDAATIGVSFDVLGVPLDIDIAPEDVQVTPDGLRILLAGSIDAPADDCVLPYGIEGSLETPSVPDPVGVTPPGLPAHHTAVQADDDLINQGLFAIWNGGLMCWTIDSSMENLPIAIDTNLLGLMAPGVFDDLFPENSPMVMQTRPTQPPVATLDGPNDIDIALTDFGLDFYAELDGRMTRLMQVELATQAGANVDFDPATGAITLDIDFDTSQIQAEVVYNELRPDANATIASSLLGIVDTLVGPQLEGLLASQTFPLPAFEGYGLTNANVSPAPGAPDRLGVYGNIGPVPYTGTGCEGGGCDGAGAGCGGNGAACDNGAAPGRVAIFAVPLLLAAMRRRRT